MDFAGGPKVVGDKDEKEYIADQAGDQDVSGHKGEGPTGDCGNHEGSGGEVDIALMCGRILAVAECKIDESGEEEHVAHRNEVEGLRIAAKRVELAGMANE